VDRVLCDRRRWLGLFAVALADACSRSGRAAPDQRAALDEPADAARRIVSLSPNTTESLFALGVGGAVVGRSRFCDYPPEVSRLPSVGGYIDASLEAILALRPDLVVGARGPAGRMLVDKLTAFGIATFFPPTESMAEIDSMLLELGARVGASARAQLLVDALRAHRSAIVRSLAGERVVRVLLLFGLSPIVAAGPSSFPNEMLGLARASNVVDTGGAYPTLGAERLLALTPDLVIDAGSMTGALQSDAAIVRADSSMKEHPTLGELAAVRAGHVVALYDEAVLRPGPRIADGLATLARALHPGVDVP
jgi:iron complex transport system substrate-binding protein